MGNHNTNDIDLLHDSIFRIGEVIGVDGRLVTVKVDKNKNLPHLLYCGRLIRNVTVGGYIKILKGFTALVGKVESEVLKSSSQYNENYHRPEEEFYRLLSIKLLGYFENGKYNKGVKEMPLIGNVCQLLEVEEFQQIHAFGDKNEKALSIGHLLVDDNVSISISIPKLFTSHIGIFGNTGSGKSYTLASLLHNLFETAESSQAFKENAKFVLFDFNGEYSNGDTITPIKKVYNLSTHSENGGDKLPLSQNDVLEPELLYIVANATEKTQQPFLKRTLALYNNNQNADDPLKSFREILQERVTRIVQMSDQIRGNMLLDYIENLLPPNNENGVNVGYRGDLSFHGQKKCYYSQGHYFDNQEFHKFISDLCIYKGVSKYNFPNTFIQKIIHYLYVQLVTDVLNNRAMNEHIAPVINRLNSLKKDFNKLFDIGGKDDLWSENNLVVIDINKTNTIMKKLIPLLVCTKLYKVQKKNKEKGLTNTLHIIIDEAHNVLSYDSIRESEAWKDFRLETFEEIIKEGRKFGVYMILASQRPSDISHTIISQLHNFLIHRLVNNKDIEMVERAISYLDKVSVESLPILPIGACVLSGVIADLPIIIQVDTLAKANQPHSENADITTHWGMDKFT